MFEKNQFLKQTKNPNFLAYDPRDTHWFLQKCQPVWCSRFAIATADIYMSEEHYYIALYFNCYLTNHQDSYTGLCFRSVLREQFI